MATLNGLYLLNLKTSELHTISQLPRSLITWVTPSLTEQYDYLVISLPHHKTISWKEGMN